MATMENTKNDVKIRMHLVPEVTPEVGFILCATIETAGWLPVIQAHNRMNIQSYRQYLHTNSIVHCMNQ